MEQIFAEMMKPSFGVQQLDANIDGIFANLDLGDSDLDFYNDPDLFDAFFNAMLDDDDFDEFFDIEEDFGFLDDIPWEIEEFEEDNLPAEEPLRMLLAESESETVEEEQTIEQARSTTGFSPIWILTLLFVIALAYGIHLNIFDSSALKQKKKKGRHNDQE